MALKDIFGKKKSVTEEKKVEAPVVVSNTRGRLENLKTEMKGIRFDEIQKKVPEDRISVSDFARYKRNFAIMLGILEKESVIKLTRLDTEEIDNVMLYMVQHFDKALKTGNKDTADRFIEGLRYGVVNGYGEIKSTDMDHAEEIMQKRLSRIEQYKAIAKLSMHIDTLEKSIALKTKDYDNHKHNYDMLLEELDKEIAMKPMVVEKIKRIGESNINSSDPEAFMLVSKMGQVSNLFKELKQLQQDIAIAQNDVNSTRSSILSATTSLNDSDSKIDDLTLEELKKYNDEHVARLRQIEEESRRLDDLNQRLFDSVDQIFSDPKVIDSMIRKTLDYEAMKREIELKNREREEGMRILNEREKLKHEQELEQEQQLLSNEY
ncbi:MAG: hypothetical protein UD936_10175 [Acutalibacteraceae bacterium]|nr:hypothetical protein [Acutalibacteraceae bacterium]